MLFWNRTEHSFWRGAGRKARKQERDSGRPHPRRPPEGALGSGRDTDSVAGLEAVARGQLGAFSGQGMCGRKIHTPDPPGKLQWLGGEGDPGIAPLSSTSHSSPLEDSLLDRSYRGSFLLPKTSLSTALPQAFSSAASSRSIPLPSNGVIRKPRPSPPFSLSCYRGGLDWSSFVKVHCFSRALDEPLVKGGCCRGKQSLLNWLVGKPSS